MAVFKIIRSLLLGLLILAGIYLIGLYNYLLFQTVVQLSSIVICAAIFMVAWNSRKFTDNQYLTFVGIAFFVC